MKRSKECSCCGGDGGKWEQFPQRDKGYGICYPCAIWIKKDPQFTDEYFESIYGQEGTHWGKKIS